ncbi:MAG: aspartate/glutamate racemase family protein, partial [Deinococcales bacterium]
MTLPGGQRRLTVGVLGGLGPEATLDFFAKVLARTPARTDQDHLHLLIDNDPGVPNRNDAVAGRGPSPGPRLATMARRLEAAGADFLVMVCNA